MPTDTKVWLIDLRIVKASHDHHGLKVWVPYDGQDEQVVRESAVEDFKRASKTHGELWGDDPDRYVGLVSVESIRLVEVAHAQAILAS